MRRDRLYKLRAIDRQHAKFRALVAVLNVAEFALLATFLWWVLSLYTRR